MEFQHNPAPQEGAPTEPATSGDRPEWHFTDRELRQMLKGGGVAQHVRTSLKVLDVMLNQVNTPAPHKHWKHALSFPESLRTRACLELIRRRTKELEEVIRRNESAQLKAARAQWNGPNIPLETNE